MSRRKEGIAVLGLTLAVLGGFALALAMWLRKKADDLPPAGLPSV